MGFSQEVCRWVAAIPAGRVATYGQIALLCARPRAARAVGTVLQKGPAGIPCHRVVNRQGRTAPGWTEQRELLRAEGIPFLPDGRVDLTACLWYGPD